MSLDRFKTAQENLHAGYKAALDEIQNGRKTGHWIWYIFPQIIGLGNSGPARLYALRDLDEACEYLRDRVLRDRLRATVDAVALSFARGISLIALMGSTTDALKLVSSLTLFERALQRLDEIDHDAERTGLRDGVNKILQIASDQGWGRCQYTVVKITSD
jgi:uncharacterized protein (DUF1810 family)